MQRLLGRSFQEEGLASYFRFAFHENKICILLQIDKLQTNHKGVFVLSDLKFRWIEKYASDDAGARQNANLLLHFSCGILRGALANLGLPSSVTAELTNIPSCAFSIKIMSPS